MKTALTIILYLIGFLTFGQKNKLVDNRKNIVKIEPEILDSLYVKALNNRIDLLLQSGWHYIEMNEYGSRIKNLNVSERYKFLTNDELVDLSIKENKTINVLRVVHNQISKDTIDINFRYVGIKRKHKFHFAKRSSFKNEDIGDKNGYQSDIRFVFDSSTNNWKIIQNRFVTINDE
ncbi:hypothetical protein [Polluticaenibacter yanchengensis]|uniref:DUF4440 domain-containing protein n=1 Tax=Polluticaenibacter yanchengensis TaxID=3014562 RepID=A0ABT4UMS7_9BACT|nr:hypothetical protein [Chitinophagaceae bacterium LY-5]